MEGFQHRPTLGLPHNYAYYDSLLGATGSHRLTDHLSGYLGGDHEQSDTYDRIAEKVKARYGLSIKGSDAKREMREWVPRAIEAHAQAFSGTAAYYPPTQAEAARFANSILSVAGPQLIKLVMKGDDVVGDLLCYPDISAGLQKARGHLLPSGWYHILRDRRRTEWANVNGLGVLPAFQVRDASIILNAELTRAIRSHGFRRPDVVRVDEANLKSCSDMEAIGVRWYNRHRTYAAPFDRAAPPL